MRFPLLAASILAAAALSGCVAKSSATNAMIGEWRVVAIDEDAPANAQAARVTFAEDDIGATVGCNSMGGPWKIEENRLIAGPLESTEMYCEGPVWNQERALAALLVAAPTVAYEDGDMLLNSRGHSARLARVSPLQRGS